MNISIMTKLLFSNCAVALFIAQFFLMARSSKAADNPTPPKFAPHSMESFEIVGSTRVNSWQMENEFGLHPGIALDDKFVMECRQKLLSLGLFRSVLLYQKKGSKPGAAKLIVELEDDDQVFSDWAWGGQFGLFYERASLSSVDPDSYPVNYSFTLLSRNLFSELYRGSGHGDFSGDGKLREARLVFGLPRFTQEDVQFDVEAQLVDVRYRYLNAQGFGGRVQGVWTTSSGDYDFYFGPAMYFNRSPRFGYHEFPTSVAGPRVGLRQETRLLGFIPGPGYLLSVSGLYSVLDARESLLEAHGAYTFELFSSDTRLSLELKALAVGVEGQSVRGESRLDVPLSAITSRTKQSANLFCRVRAGTDHYKAVQYSGSSAVFGVQYFSSSFIADLGFEITQSPRQLYKDNLDEAHAHGEYPQ